MKKFFINNLKLKRTFLIFYFKTKTIFYAIVIFFLILLFCTRVLDSFKKKLVNKVVLFTAELGFVVKKVHLENSTNFTLEDLYKILKVEKKDPIFGLDLKSISNLIMEHPLIHNLVLERRLPDTLYISVKENIPIAIWQFDKTVVLIDKNAQIIDVKNIYKFKDLLYVIGQDANLYANRLLEDLKVHENLFKRLKYAVHVGKRRWDLLFEEDIKIKMPEKDFSQAYNYLNNLFMEQKLFNNNYKILDLRDISKFYIQKS